VLKKQLGHHTQHAVFEIRSLGLKSHHARPLILAASGSLEAWLSLRMSKPEVPETKRSKVHQFAKGHRLAHLAALLALWACHESAPRTH